jgi:hypothetical protein
MIDTDALLCTGVDDWPQQREAAALTVDAVLEGGKVTFRPPPLRRSQIPKPMSFRPSSGRDRRWAVERRRRVATNAW